MTTPTNAPRFGSRGLLTSVFRVFVGVVVIGFIATVFLLPYAWMVASGFKDQTQIFSDLTPVSWKTFIPLEPILDNVITLFTQKGVGRALVNSLLVAAVQVVGALIMCSLAAYALTRIRFRGHNVVFILILVTFMVPTEAMVVALYSVVSGIGLQDSIWAAPAPWIASVFGLFLLRQSFEQLPFELDEAARIDGAGHFRTFWSIVLPNVKTALVTLALVTFLFSWNSFLWPLVIIQSPENQLIQVAIAHSVAPGELPNWGVTFAGAALATLPLIVLFLLLQRYFVRGLATTGMK